MCSNGGFQQSYFLAALIAAGRQQCRHIPILADDNFRFPSPSFLESQRNNILDITDDLEAVIGLICGVFRTIAVVFQPQHYSSTELLLETKAKEIHGRLIEPDLLCPLEFI